MKNFLYSLFAILLFYACTNSSGSGTDISDAPKTAVPAEVTDQNFAGKAPAELADAACKCFEALYQLREKAKKGFEDGDRNAYTNADSGLIEERGKAKKCTRAVVKPLIGNDPAIEQFEKILMEKCRHSYSNILLLSRIKFKPEE